MQLPDLVDAPLDGQAPGIAGHSRGGKVTWLMMIDDAARARAIAGVDPVDGQGGPFGGEARALDNAIDFGGVPSLVLGTGLGPMPINAFAPACAPEGDAHARFYARTSPPVWHGVATAHGHNDMLNDDGCGFLCAACLEGPDRASMRRYVAGQLVAHFGAALKGDAAARAVLTMPDAAPLPATAESR
jgi:pimeloyl-ACP methyl ester carboxylesterase